MTVGRAWRRRQGGWLSDAVESQLRASRRAAPLTLRQRIIALASPKPLTAIWIAGATCASIFFSWLLTLWNPSFLSSQSGITVLTERRVEDLHAALWQVHVAVAAIALPLLVFTIDLIGSRPGVVAPTQEVLIRKSFIFPILCFGLSSTIRVGVDALWFSSPAVLAVDVIVLGALIMLAILAFTRSLALIFSRARLQQQAILLLSERMDEVVERSLRDRLANSILFGELAERDVGYYRWAERRDKERYLTLSVRSPGRWRDIHLVRLTHVLDSLPRVGATAGPSPNVFGLQDAEDNRIDRENAWVQKRIGEFFTDEDSDLLRLDRSAFEEIDEAGLEEILRRIVKVEAAGAEDKATEMRTELSYLRDALTDGIAGGRTGQVEEALSIYQELFSTFLRKLHQLEGSEALHLVTSQDGMFLTGGWAEIDWITRDMRHAIEEASIARNTTVLLEVSYVPTHLADIAFRFRDLRIFLVFLELIPYSYWTIAAREPDRIRDLGVDRSWRYLTERLDFRIRPALEAANTPKEAVRVGHFATGAMNQFNRLLKYSYDLRHRPDFGKFADGLNSVLGYWDDVAGELDAASWDLENGYLSEEAQASTKARVDLLSAQEKARGDLFLRRQVIQFGIGAWIIFDYSRERVESAQALEYLGSLRLPSSPDELWNVFSAAVTYGEWGDLEWTSWELDTKTETEAHFIEFRSYLQLFFLLKALDFLGQGQEFSFPETTDFKYLAGTADAPFNMQLGSVENNPDRWRPIIGEAALGAIPTLKERLAAVAELVKATERKALAEAPLDEEKTREIVDRLARSWRSEGLSRRLAEQHGAYQRVDVQPGEDVLPFGLNQLDNKIAYVRETDVHTIDWGETYGRALADGENETFLALLQDRLVRSSEQNQTAGDLPTRVKSALDRLRARGLQPVILINRSWKAWSALERSSLFEPPRGDEDPTPLGYLDGSPFFSMHGKQDAAVLVLDIRATIGWTQFPPPNLSETQITIDESIAFAVEAFTPERAQSLIETWTQDGETKWTVDELLERVGLRIFERFEISIKDPESGIILSADTPPVAGQ